MSEPKKKPSELTIDEMIAEKNRKEAIKPKVCTIPTATTSISEVTSHGPNTSSAGDPPRATIGESTTEAVKPSIVEKVKDKVQSVLGKNEMLVVRCNICQKDYLFGRKDRNGKPKPEAQCVHLTFKGIEEQ